MRWAAPTCAACGGAALLAENGRRAGMDGASLTLEPETADSNSRARADDQRGQDGPVSPRATFRSRGSAGGQVALRWAESVAAVAARAAGTRAIERMIRNQLKGEVRFDWRAEGWCARWSPEPDFARARRQLRRASGMPVSAVERATAVHVAWRLLSRGATEQIPFRRLAGLDGTCVLVGEGHHRLSFMPCWEPSVFGYLVLAACDVSICTGDRVSAGDGDQPSGSGTSRRRLERRQAHGTRLSSAGTSGSSAAGPRPDGHGR